MPPQNCSFHWSCSSSVLPANSSGLWSRLFSPKLKARGIEVLVATIFYSGALEIFNRLVNRFKPSKSSDGTLRFPFIKKRQSGNLQILAYHRVNDEADPFFPGTPTNVFAGQMEFLSRNFNVCLLDDAIEMLQTGELPDNSIVVTLDDGYMDNFTNAFPILKNFSIPASIFLAVGAITNVGATNSREPLWHDRVFRAFRETKLYYLDNYAKPSKTYLLTNQAEKLLAQQRVLKFLWSLNETDRAFWIDRLLDQLEVVKACEAEDLMLTWDRIRVMHENGISFGSHTVTHPILSRVSTERLKQEIYASKRAIEQHLGTSVKSFAYPVGRKEDFDDTVKDLVKDAGYSCALTTIFGTNEKGQDRFELRRHIPWETNVAHFAIRLNYYKAFS